MSMQFKFFVPLVLLTVTHSVTASSLHPFVDLNLITKVELDSAGLTFHTPNGQKRLQLKTNEWSYSTNSGVTFPGTKPNYYSPNIKIKLPIWYPKSTYNTINFVDNIKKPQWILVSRAGEGATYSSQDLINLKTGQVYSFPYEQIRNFTVINNTVWLGGTFGVSRLDLTSLTRTRFHTLPIFKNIISYMDSNQIFYYLTYNHGLFSVNKKTGEINTVTKINNYLEKRYKFTTAKEINGTLWLTAIKQNASGYFKGSTLLLKYNPDTGAIEEIDTQVRFANQLKFYNNKTIVGYGSHTEGYEGGESAAYGGIFRYNLDTKTLKVLSEKPVNTLQLNPPKAMGIWVTEEPILVNYFESSNLETPFSVVKSEWVCRSSKNHESSDPYTGKKVIHTADPVHFKELHDIYKKTSSLDRNSIISKKNIDMLSDLKIILKTIELPTKKVEMRQYDPNSKKPPAQHYY